MITAEHERDLIIRAQAGDREAAGQLVKAHEGIICQYVKRIGGDIEDMMQEARLSALRAIRHFDLSRGFRFTTFAIRKVVWDVRRAKDGLIHVPSTLTTENNKARAFQVRMVRSIDDKPSEDCPPLSRTLSDGSDSVGDLETREAVEWLREEIDRLPSRERAVIIGRMEGLTLQQIADTLHLSRERIRQIEAEVHATLRVAMRGCAA